MTIYFNIFKFSNITGNISNIDITINMICGNNDYYEYTFADSINEIKKVSIKFSEYSEYDVFPVINFYVPNIL